jgi:dUTP pyrophosphatase
MQVQFKLLHPNAKLPERAHAIDVGLDIFTPEAGILKPGPNLIPLGFSMEVPVGYSSEVRPRSGMASGVKTKDLLLYRAARATDRFKVDDVKVSDVYENGICIFAMDPPIDPGYDGEVHAIILNTSDHIVQYPAHTRFGQLVFYPIAYAQPVVSVDKSRGASGFGDSGV